MITHIMRSAETQNFGEVAVLSVILHVLLSVYISYITRHRKNGKDQNCFFQPFQEKMKFMHLQLIPVLKNNILK
jgi:hypothetical protein